jgi:hypothetical protein
MPATIDDPEILGNITETLISRGVINNTHEADSK